MYKDTMTPRERWLAVLNHQKPDRIPMDIWGTQEVWDGLCAHFGCDSEEVCERLHIDAPLILMGRYVGPPLPPNTDHLGVVRKRVDYGTGAYDEVCFAPLAQYNSVEEIEANYQWPTADWFDYSYLKEAVKGNEHRPIRAGISEPMLWYKYMRGEEQAFMDLLVNPDIVHYCLDKLFGHAYEDACRIYEAIPGQVTVTYVAEDLGSQSGLLFSPEQIKEFLLPRMKRMMDLVRQNGAYVFTHSDGAIRDVISDLIDIGMHVLNPIQWRCEGMEREGLQRDFGDKITFHGAMDNQHTIPFGSVEEVREEVIENLRIFGSRNNYILAPCHNIQPVTPVENIIAMYETGYVEGRK